MMNVKVVVCVCVRRCLQSLPSRVASLVGVDPHTAPRLCLLGAVRLHRPRSLKFKPVPIIEYNIASSATRECERGENDCRRFASIRFASEDG